MPAKSKNTHFPGPTEDGLPDFNPDTLRSLTEKIESNLKNPITKGVPAKLMPKTLNFGSKPRQHAVKASESNYVVNNANNGIKTRGMQKPTVARVTSQGKKRSCDGYVKGEGYGKISNTAIPLKLGSRTWNTGSDSNTVFEEEVRALGGTKEDVDLIAGIASESEIEGEEVGLSTGSRLEKKILQLVRQLDVDRMDKRELLAESESVEADEVKVLEEDNHPKLISSNAKKSTIKPALPSATSGGKGQRSMIFLPHPEWHTAAPSPPSLPSRETSTLPPDLLDRLHSHAKALLENENMQYAKSNRSASSSHQFYSTIMSTGTLSDKISALTLSIQESPVHNMKALQTLVGLAGKRSRGQAVEVLGALKDLFGPGKLLPSGRKLRFFASQPALSNAFDHFDFNWTSQDPLPNQIKQIDLVSWAYEDWLKGTFFEVVKIIETWCNDEVLFARGKAVDYVYQLLRERPEQEANLLRLLVNKLGDSDKKIASKASFNILQLETTHPLMKPTIIAAIESGVLFRPGQSLYAKYYATITLNQTVLSREEGGVGEKLLDIYFSLFIQLLKKSGEASTAAAGIDSNGINKKGEIQGGGGSAGKKAQKRLAEKERATAVDEELREKMLSAVLTGVNRAVPFTDTNEASFKRHLDTLFKVTHSSNFNTSIQALMLIQQLNESHQGSIDRFYRTLYESLLDPRLLTSSKQALYLNLLFRSLKSDFNVKRVKAFAKRLLQVVAMHQPSFSCGTLYLLRELEGVFANLEAFMDQKEEDSDDEEDFRDVQEQLSNGTTADNGLSPHKTNKLISRYHGRKRDPKYSNAERSSLWEVTPFLQHYHPSVALFATRLVTHNEMPPKPDLSLNTLIHFLDRFVYRNPKTTNVSRGSSIMQPMAGGNSSALLLSAYSQSTNEQPVNSEAFWKQRSENVNADEVFFHKYFRTLGRNKDKTSNKKTERRLDADESGNEGDEDEIWKALVESRPELDRGSDGGFGDEDIESDMEKIDDDEIDSELAEQGEYVDRDIAEGAESLLGLDNENDEALWDSNDEVPSEIEDALDKEVSSSKPRSIVGPGAETRGSKRRRLKSLPTFASADDYAKMLEEEDEEEFN